MGGCQVNIPIRPPIAVTRPYSSSHQGAYTITRVMSKERLYDQYFIGKVTPGPYGLSYDMRSDRPEGYDAFSGPMTDADIAAIKQGIAWHETRPEPEVSSLVWIEGVTS